MTEQELCSHCSGTGWQFDPLPTYGPRLLAIACKRCNGSGRVIAT